MIERLVSNDIQDIQQMLYQNDSEFLERVLRGNGWTGYDQMTDEQVKQEYQDREFDN